MNNKRIKQIALLLSALLIFNSCKIPKIVQRTENKITPNSYNSSNNIDTVNTADISWRTFFTDSNLVRLIDTALVNNQELMITLQEIEISKNEIRSKKGALLPFVTGNLGIGGEKVGRYTSKGASDAAHDIAPDKEIPEFLPDFKLGLAMDWEIDIWKKLRNAKKAAVKRYLASVEGKNFVLSNLIAENAKSYYELVALDNQLEAVRQNIQIQTKALDVVKILKDAARANELGVQKFEAEVYGTKSKEYEILQEIKATENRINLLLGRFPQPIVRNSENFTKMLPPIVHTGIPAQLLANRPDIKQAELELDASKLDVKVAKAEFYPALKITAEIGIDAFRPSFWVKMPESIFSSLAGSFLAPLFNRNAIMAEYLNANAKQKQAVFNYEKCIINGYYDVSTQIYNIDNLDKNYKLKSQQINVLDSAVTTANDLLQSSRADYFEVLMTQRDVLESKLELIETKKAQLNAVIEIYRSLGGGWK